MKIATTSFCLLVALVASASTDAKTVKLHLRVNMDDKSIAVLKAAPKTIALNSSPVHKHLSKGYIAPSTHLSKAATTATSEDDEEDYEIRACESVVVQPWISTLEYACSAGSSTYGYSFVYKLANGTYFANDRCESSDRTGLDKVFAKAMEGAELTYEEDNAFNAKCFSQQHATYVAKDHPEFDSEFDYVANQFSELDGDENEDDNEEFDE